MNFAEEIGNLHQRLLYDTIAADFVHHTIDDGIPFQKFKGRCRSYLKETIYRNAKTSEELLKGLEQKGEIEPGRYEVLKELVDFDVAIVEKVTDTERAINSFKTRGNERHRRKRKAPPVVERTDYIDGKSV